MFINLTPCCEEEHNWEERQEDEKERVARETNQRKWAQIVPGKRINWRSAFVEDKEKKMVRESQKRKWTQIGVSQLYDLTCRIIMGQAMASSSLICFWSWEYQAPKRTICPSRCREGGHICRVPGKRSRSFILSLKTPFCHLHAEKLNKI